METFTITILWLTALALPVIVFLVFRPHTRLYNALAALVAITAGWSFNSAYAFAAQAITAREPSGVNGAANAFAAIFGWVVPSILVLLTWLAWRLVRRRMSPDPFVTKRGP